MGAFRPRTQADLGTDSRRLSSTFGFLKVDVSFIGFIVTLITLLLLPVVHAQTVITHLSYPGHGDAWPNWVEERATAYERLNPGIEIEIMQSSGNAVDHFVALRAGGTLPDVSEMPITHGARFASEEYFLDLKPFVERDNTISLDMFVPITVDALTWTDNSLWGLPADVYVVPTYYNKGFFAEAGLASPNDLGDDWNWESVVSSGKKLTRDTNNDGQPERIAITGFSGMWSHMDVVRKAGGQLYDRYKDPTESLLNTPRDGYSVAGRSVQGPRNPGTVLVGNPRRYRSHVVCLWPLRHQDTRGSRHWFRHRPST